MKNKVFLSLIVLFIITTNNSNNLLAIFEEQREPENIIEENLENEGLITADNFEKIDLEIDLKSKDYVNVIVEFDLHPAKITVAEEKKMNRTLKEETVQKEIAVAHQEFEGYINNLKKQRDNNQTSITYQYSYAYVGVSLKIRAVEIEELFKMELVKAIHKDQEIIVAPNTNDFAFINLEKKYDMKSNQQISADLLQKEGITGTGVKVGVLDTGIDYNHPDLKTAYKGYTKTVDVDASQIEPTAVRGWDFIDNDADPMEATYADWQASGKPEFNYRGSSYYTSHGTHVSGTIAGNPNNEVGKAITGVAPGVDLYSYRVLGPYGSGSLSGIVAGIDKALYDDMDVINLSLGGGADPTSPSTIAINNANLQGLITVISAGNSGPTTDTVGSPGDSSYAITVGASTFAQNQETFTLETAINAYDDLKLWAYSQEKHYAEILEKEIKYEFFDLGYANEFENMNLENKVAVIKRGELAFVTKAENAANAGAEAIIIYNNVAGEINNYLGIADVSLPIFFISQKTGEALVENTNSSFIITNERLTTTKGDELASLSSRGPTWLSSNIKPEVIAPGINIYSSYPSFISNPEDSSDYSNAYSSISGTSMSAPHVSGTVALILQTHPNLTPEQIKARLMNTADVLEGNYSVHEAGAGRVNAYNAFYSEVEFKSEDYAIHSYNKDLDGLSYELVPYETSAVIYEQQYKGETSQRSSKKIAITNHSSKNKTFNIQAVFNSNLNNRPAANINKVSIKVNEQVIVKKNQTKNLNTRIVVPKKATAGIYEGQYIFTNADNLDEVYKMPFTFEVKDVGIKIFNVPYPLLSSVCRDNYVARSINFQLQSPMKEVQIIVVDKSTQTPLGLITHSTLSGELGNIPQEDDVFFPDVSYGLNNSGYMYEAIFNEDNTFTEGARVALPEGEYDLLLRTVGLNEDVYTKTFSGYYINNTPPKLEFFDEGNNIIENGVLEVTQDMLKTIDVDGEKTKVYELIGKINDPYVKHLNNAGYDYFSQTQNSIKVQELKNNEFVSPFPKYYYSNNDEGLVSFYIEEKDIFSEKYNYSVMFTPTSSYGCGTGDNMTSLAFTTAEKTYLATRYEKEVMMADETNVLTVSLNNVTNFLDGEFNITTGTHLDNPFKIKSVDFSTQFKEYADIKFTI